MVNFFNPIAYGILSFFQLRGEGGFLAHPQNLECAPDLFRARDHYAVDSNGIVKSWASTGEIYQENEFSVEYLLPMYGLEKSIFSNIYF